MPVRVLCLILLLGALPQAGASEAELPLWELGIGLSTLRFPDYRGADQYQSYLIPTPAIIYRGERLQMDDRGLRGLLFDSERVIMDISMDGAVPVDSSQNGAREGMPDLDAALEVGPSLKFILHRQGPHEARLNLPLRLVYTSDFRTIKARGSLFHPNLSFDHRNQWNFSTSIGPLYANRRYHDYYYGVDEAYATAERPAYQAGNGYSGLRTTVTFSRRFERFWWGAFFRYDNLKGAQFEDSPLLRRDHSWMGGTTLMWFFFQSAERVPRRPHQWAEEQEECPGLMERVC